jgi:hypothetical protein
MKMIFLHLPKCAGTSVLKFLAAAAGAERVAPHLGRVPAYVGVHCLKEFDVVCGHFTGRVFHHEFAEIRHAVVLRHPVERFLSAYFFLRDTVAKTTPASGLSQLVTRLSLGEIVQSRDPLAEVMLANPMTRRLAAVHHSPVVADVSLERAAANLQGFEVVGTAEDLDGFFSDMATMLGVARPDQAFHERRSTTRQRAEEIAPDVRGILHERLSLDMALWHAARELVAARRQGSACSHSGSSLPAAPKRGGIEVSKRLVTARSSGGAVSLEFEIASKTVRDELTISLALRIASTDVVIATRVYPRQLSVSPGERYRLALGLRLPFETGLFTVDIAITGGWPEADPLYAEVRRFASIYVQNAVAVPSDSLVMVDWQLDLAAKLD